MLKIVEVILKTIQIHSDFKQSVVIKENLPR